MNGSNVQTSSDLYNKSIRFIAVSFALWLIVSIVVFVKFLTRQVCGTGPEPEWSEQMNRKEE